MIWQANTPTAYFPKSDGWSLYSLCTDLGIGGEILLFPNRAVVVPTNLSVRITPGYCMILSAPEKIHNRRGVHVLNSVQSDFAIEDLNVVLLNTDSTKITLRHGDLIAYAAIAKIHPDADDSCLSYGEAMPAAGV